MITSLDKALIALAGAILYFLSNYAGIVVSPELTGTIQTVIVALTPVLVYLVPNKH